MSRPLRLEFPGAIYHVTSRGDRSEAVYRDDADRVEHLNVLEQALDRFDAEVLACCLMGNHYRIISMAEAKGKTLPLPLPKSPSMTNVPKAP